MCNQRINLTLSLHILPPHLTPNTPGTPAAPWSSRRYIAAAGRGPCNRQPKVQWPKQKKKEKTPKHVGSADAASYLQRWAARATTATAEPPEPAEPGSRAAAAGQWKFNKATQTWLIANLYNKALVVSENPHPPFSSLLLFSPFKPTKGPSFRT